MDQDKIIESNIAAFEDELSNIPARLFDGEFHFDVEDVRVLLRALRLLQKHEAPVPEVVVDGVRYVPEMQCKMS
jgi:hypothetical protein